MSAPREGLLELLDDVVPGELHRAVYDACMAPRWSFGNRSTEDQAARPFWVMDMTGVEAVDQFFSHVRPECERLVGGRLRLLRQYANGHTYGLGGRPHFDDVRPGAVTLLYYPALVWKPEWEGETLFFSPAGHIVAGVAVAPNRGILFDARMLHAGRAPSRDCPELRITLALKLIMEDP